MWGFSFLIFHKIRSDVIYHAEQTKIALVIRGYFWTQVERSNPWYTFCMPVTKRTTNKLALIVVDMQDFFLEKIPTEKRKTLINDQASVINYAAKNKLPVIVLEYKGRGRTIGALRSRLKFVPDLHVIVKENNGGFTKTILDDTLRNLGTKEILLMGVTASGCVQDTAIGALRRGYKIITSRELIASSSKRDSNLATSRKWYSKNGLWVENVQTLITRLKSS